MTDDDFIDVSGRGQAEGEPSPVETTALIHPSLLGQKEGAAGKAGLLSRLKYMEPSA